MRKKKECASTYPSRALPHIRKQTDEKLISSIQKPVWYRHLDPYHRFYMRALYEEALSRGLEVPKVPAHL